MSRLDVRLVEVQATGATADDALNNFLEELNRLGVEGYSPLEPTGPVEVRPSNTDALPFRARFARVKGPTTFVRPRAASGPAN